MKTRIAVAAMVAAGVWPVAAAPVDFRTRIQPVLEQQCLACHNPQKAGGGLRLDTRSSLLKAGTGGPAVVPGRPEQSPLYRSVASGAMPPGGPRLDAAALAALRDWIAEGAPWPDGAVLTLSKQPAGAPDERAVVAQLRARILAATEERQAADMHPYRTVIPGTEVAFEMVPVPAGAFEMGTPASEKGHKPDEAPQHRVQLDPFWMEKYEVTWDEYRLFMFANQAGDTAHPDPLVDAISRPTRPYMEMSFGMGINGYPAISMTQHAANKYCEWLSAKTGRFYRLPTEAEWEYACRAGTTTAYSFGDDPSQLGDYAWYGANSGGKYHQVGTKKPNPWGLYDMHGNVMEWTLDQYLPNFYKQFAGKTAVDPWAPSTTPYPQAVRGGSWNDPAAQLRCGCRVGSDPSWKMQDPQIPKSIWYHTDAQWLGFRIVRPLKIPSAEEMYRYWNNGVEKDE